MGSYLDAKFNDGQWIVRIEDLDRQREIKGAASRILHTLEALGMEWDGQVVYQSQRLTYYQAALDELNQRDLIYPCVCSRKEIADSSIVGINGPIYPGTCGEGPMFVKDAHALRVRTHHKPIVFKDFLRGLCMQNLKQEIGDFILRRADGFFSYQLAVVVDDAQQGITHVVRGADLLDSTPRQIFLQQLLGYDTPYYMHLPVVINSVGEKLSKQTRAPAIELSCALMYLVQAIRFLGQNPPAEIVQGDIASFWQWAKKNWRIQQIPRDSARGINSCA
ncbi:glutamyl-Q tRNA(Asp) synthetase [Nitrosomonas sp. PY1]|nr:glutamyl-Q tRNA(Asp) synthetase [Nitrosomonas sp. PY1]